MTIAKNDCHCPNLIRHPNEINLSPSRRYFIRISCSSNTWLFQSTEYYMSRRLRRT
ncbi:MAG TPA: pyruvate kinase, partial [Shigella sp.]|nr:pyruvate kinase [Shigella sp.]